MENTPEFRIVKTDKWIWICRASIVILIIMAFILRFFKPGEVLSKRTAGETTIYYQTALMTIILIVFGIIMCLIAVNYLKYPRLVFKFFGVCLFALAAFTFLYAPNDLRQKLVVTPDYFYNRTGAWFYPVETRADFNSLVYITVKETEKDKHGHPEYELQLFKKPDGKMMRIPCNSMIKAALPEILDRASKKDVAIGEDIDISVE